MLYTSFLSVSRRFRYPSWTSHSRFRLLQLALTLIFSCISGTSAVQSGISSAVCCAVSDGSLLTCSTMLRSLLLTWLCQTSPLTNCFAVRNLGKIGTWDTFLVPWTRGTSTDVKKDLCLSLQTHCGTVTTWLHSVRVFFLDFKNGLAANQPRALCCHNSYSYY